MSRRIRYNILMTDYTHLNLAELENMSPKYGHDKDMEARFATRPLALKQSGLGYQKVLPNRSIPFLHKHEYQEEVFVIISGSGQMVLDNDIIELKPLDAVRVAPKVVRTLKAGPEGLEVVITGAPNRGGNDTVMV